MPQLTSADLVILDRLGNARELFIETHLQLRLVLFSGKLLRGATLSLVQALGVGGNDSFVLFIHSGSSTLETFAPLSGRCQLRLQRRQIAGLSSSRRSKFCLGRLENLQLLFVFGFLFRPFLIFVVRNIAEVIDLVVQSSSGILGLSNGSFQLERALLLPVLIRTALKTIVKVVQFLSNLRDSKLVIVFGLSESRALFVQFRFGVNDGVL